MSYKDLHLTLTEEQVKTETARCLSCGASYVDPNLCIGCGLCTTKCRFDAIHLVRDNPKCSDMRVAEDKVTGLLKYELSRLGKIVANAGSEDAKIMREKRKEWKKAQKG
jgi:ferredoxin